MGPAFRLRRRYADGGCGRRYLDADVKTKNGQALQGAITALGVQPGTEWLKGLNTRNDVQWNVVRDASDSWNYKSQSLNRPLPRWIAIAAAAVTAGTGLASLAGSGAITATGVTGATASAACVWLSLCRYDISGFPSCRRAG